MSDTAESMPPAGLLATAPVIRQGGYAEMIGKAKPRPFGRVRAFHVYPGKKPAAEDGYISLDLDVGSAVVHVHMPAFKARSLGDMIVGPVRVLDAWGLEEPPLPASDAPVLSFGKTVTYGVERSPIEGHLRLYLLSEDEPVCATFDLAPRQVVDIANRLKEAHTKMPQSIREKSVVDFTKFMTGPQEDIPPSPIDTEVEKVLFPTLRARISNRVARLVARFR